jgi:hypothetical protein
MVLAFVRKCTDCKDRQDGRSDQNLRGTAPACEEKTGKATGQEGAQKSDELR